VWAGRVLTDACGLEPKPKKACVTTTTNLYLEPEWLR
jgi:hypothetical protein